jgi:hypothetical protein
MGWRDEIAKTIIKAATPAPKVAAPIRTFHSSPYDFERFDPSKIGTGQGSASYGVGHYLAENPKVSGQGGEYWKEFLPRTQLFSERSAAKALHEAGFDRAQAIDNIRREIVGDDAFLRSGKADDLNYLRKQIEDKRTILGMLESGRPVGPAHHEVDIHARPEQFLDR